MPTFHVICNLMEYDPHEPMLMFNVLDGYYEKACP